MKKLQIIGTIGKDAEQKSTKNGKSYILFTVAINENYKDSNGEWVDKTQWVNCQLYGDKVDATRFTKGSKIFCEGKLDTSIYESKVNWYLTVNNYEIVSKPNTSSNGQQSSENQSSDSNKKNNNGEDDLLF